MADGVNHIVELDDVWMAEFPHETDFSDGRGRCAFVCIEVDFFQSYSLSSGSRATLEYGQCGQDQLDVAARARCCSCVFVP